jgi:hypothetical protein
MNGGNGVSTTTSRVGRLNDALNEFMRKQCALVAEYGGTFAVRDVYDGNWFTEYTINWPLSITTAGGGA